MGHIEMKLSLYATYLIIWQDPENGKFYTLYRQIRISMQIYVDSLCSKNQSIRKVQTIRRLLKQPISEKRNTLERLVNEWPCGSNRKR